MALSLLNKSCVNLPPRDSHSLIYYPHVTAGVGITSWSNISEEQFAQHIERYRYAVVNNLEAAIDYIDDQHDDPIDGSYYMAQLVYIHYCVSPLAENAADLFTPEVLVHTLNAGFISAYLALLNDMPLDSHQLDALAEETAAAEHAATLLHKHAYSNSILRQIANYHRNTIVADLAQSLITDKELEDTGAECKLPQRFRQELVDLDEKFLPNVCMNSAANMEDICCCINDTMRHLDRLKRHGV